MFVLDARARGSVRLYRCGETNVGGGSHAGGCMSHHIMLFFCMLSQIAIVPHRAAKAGRKTVGLCRLAASWQVSVLE